MVLFCMQVNGWEIQLFVIIDSRQLISFIHATSIFPEKHEASTPAQKIYIYFSKYTNITFRNHGV